MKLSKYYAIKEQLQRYLVKPLAETFQKVNVVVHKLIVKEVKAKRDKVIDNRVGENVIRLHWFLDIEH